MTNSDFQNRAAFLRSQIDPVAAIPITYARDNLASTGFATPAATRDEVSDDHGFLTRLQVRDYLIGPALIAALAIAGIEMPPKTGDQITEADNTIFEIAALPNEEVWRWHDRTRTTYRAHSKQIS